MKKPTSDWQITDIELQTVKYNLPVLARCGRRFGLLGVSALP